MVWGTFMVQLSMVVLMEKGRSISLRRIKNPATTRECRFEMRHTRTSGHNRPLCASPKILNSFDESAKASTPIAPFQGNCVFRHRIARYLATPIVEQRDNYARRLRTTF